MYLPELAKKTTYCKVDKETRGMLSEWVERNYGEQFRRELKEAVDREVKKELSNRIPIEVERELNNRIPLEVEKKLEEQLEEQRYSTVRKIYFKLKDSYKTEEETAAFVASVMDIPLEKVKEIVADI